MSELQKIAKLEELLIRYKRIPQFFMLEGELIDVNQTGLDGDTPLHVACMSGNLQDVQLLIECGARVNQQGDMGNTPLHSAITADDPAIIQLLIDHGAEISATNEFGQTPRDLAVITGRSHLLYLFDGNKDSD